MEKPEKQVVARFLVPESYFRRSYQLAGAKAYGIISDIGRAGYLKELEERERQQASEEQKAKAS